MAKAIQVGKHHHQATLAEAHHCLIWQNCRPKEEKVHHLRQATTMLYSCSNNFEIKCGNTQFGIST
ncbi:hypothetical protein CCACVL1_04090, partial [Corchorus capsularis]